MDNRTALSITQGSRQHILRRERWHYDPIVPLVGCSPQQALTGAPGTVPGSPALNPNCFGALAESGRFERRDPFQ